MKTTYFRSPPVMMLVFSVLMVVMINASEKKNEEGNGLLKKAPIIMSKFEKDRLLHIWAILNLKISENGPVVSINIQKIIFSFLGLFAPSDMNPFPYRLPFRYPESDGQISSDGHFLLTLTRDRKSLYLLDLTDNAKPVQIFSQNDELDSYALAKNRSLVAGVSICHEVGGSKCKVYLWNVFSGTLVKTIVSHYEHSETVRYCRFFLHDTRIAIASYQEIRVWEVKTDQYRRLQSIQVFNHQINNLVASSNSELLLYTQASNRSIHVVDSNTGQELPNFFEYNLRDDPEWEYFGMTLEQDQYFSTVDSSQNIDIWNMTTGKRTKTFNIAGLRADVGWYTVQYVSSKWVVLRGIHEGNPEAQVVVVYDLQNDKPMEIQDGNQISLVQVLYENNLMIISRYNESIQMKVYSLGTEKSIEKD